MTLMDDIAERSKARSKAVLDALHPNRPVKEACALITPHALSVLENVLAQDPLTSVELARELMAEAYETNVPARNRLFRILTWLGRNTLSAFRRDGADGVYMGRKIVRSLWHGYNVKFVEPAPAAKRDKVLTPFVPTHYATFMAMQTADFAERVRLVVEVVPVLLADVDAEYPIEFAKLVGKIVPKGDEHKEVRSDVYKILQYQAHFTLAGYSTVREVDGVNRRSWHAKNNSAPSTTEMVCQHCGSKLPSV